MEVSDDGGGDSGGASEISPGSSGNGDRQSGDDEDSLLVKVFAWMLLTPVLVVMGATLAAGALAVHYLNELSDAQRLAGLAAGSELAREVSADVVSPANEDRLVYLTGNAVARGTVTDPELGVSVEGVQLLRAVRMYQWEEKVSERVTSRDNGTETSVKEYDYEPRWSERWIDSSAFRGSEPKRNPPAMPYERARLLSSDVSVGAFRLNESQVMRVGTRENVDVSAMRDSPKVRDGTLKIANGEFYVGRNPAAPEVGDLRISYSMWRPGPVSILARQAGVSFEPFDGWSELHAGALPSFDQAVADLMSRRALLGSFFTEIDELRNGTVSKKEMFSSARRDRTLATWGLRAAATVVLIIGLQMLVWPFKILLSVISPLRRLFALARGYLSVRAGIALTVITCSYVQLTTRAMLDPAAVRLFPQLALIGFFFYVVVGSFHGRAWNPFATVKEKV